MAGALAVQIAAKRSGVVSSGAFFLTFFVHTIAALPEVYSWATRLSGRGRVEYSGEQFTRLYNGWHCALFIAYFLSILAETFLLCFASKRAAPVDTRFMRSPEPDSSFLNRLTLWYFNVIAIKGSKRDIEVDDLFGR